MTDCSRAMPSFWHCKRRFSLGFFSSLSFLPLIIACNLSHTTSSTPFEVVVSQHGGVPFICTPDMDFLKALLPLLVGIGVQLQEENPDADRF